MVLGAKSDSQLLGRSLADVGKADPRLGTYLVTFMDTMCQQMMMYGLLQVAIAWYGIRRGQAWALWSSVVAYLSSYVYLLVTGRAFVSAGVSAAAVWGDALFFFLPFTVIFVFATWLGASGLKRTLAAA